jgi:AcrR family transcriptional regulator
MNRLESLPRRGRTREFCADEALARALETFWTKGYEGTSVTDLVAAMGIGRPSLYAAFGNKEELFKKALDLYEREKMAYVRQALAEPRARRVAQALLQGTIEIVSRENQPQGCLRVISSVPCGSDADSIRSHVAERSKAAREALVQRFTQAGKEGDLPEEVDPAGLAGMLLATLQGISVQAREGANRQELEAAATAVLDLWPSS